MKKKREILYIMPKKRKGIQERENQVEERTSPFGKGEEILMMRGEEIIGLEDAEREAVAVIRRRMYKIENLLIKSSNLTQVGDRSAYVIMARVDTAAKKGRFRRGGVETQNVEVLIDASSGECIGFRGIELEE